MLVSELIADDLAVPTSQVDSLVDADVETVCAIFAALAEPTRLRIVHHLFHTEASVGELARQLGLALPAVSQHLRVLRERRIVRTRRDGKMIYYALDDGHVADIFSTALTHGQGKD